MDFLKKHYEKILLAVLLSVFIGLLAFQLVLWQQSKLIQVEMKVKAQVENYKHINFDAKDSQYLALQSLDKQVMWNTVSEPGLDRRIVSDFMVPYPMAVCPHCKRIIPVASFPTGEGMGTCPFNDCRHELSAPESFARGKNQDTDGDGIPDEEEKKLGLNPNDAKDGKEDADLDGFTNYEEFICKTDYKNPKSRPPYHEKMFVRDTAQAVLPFVLKNVSYNGARTKENAKLQIETKSFASALSTRKQRTRLITLDLKKDKAQKKDAQSFDFECFGTKYVIVDVIPKYAKSSEAGQDNIMQKEATEIIVSPVKNLKEKILVQIGKEVREPRPKASLGIDFKSIPTYGLKPSYFLDDQFLIQFSNKTFADEYTLVGIDLKKKTVTLKFKKDGKTYVIGEDTILNKKILDLAKKQRAARRTAGKDSERE